ncbi:MAG: hypothetical protein Q8O26_19430 [Phreatobacter sp.]|uniref:STY0301 family protein n=1 Tax=Phreatobacter sp. TaxID=1966341 RepID=UPI002735377F|nr:STY0301 family protein [Phreatobacter sp.]MDP2804048.1 hypothetical protein [Phreatobacter sp.]
MTRRCALAFAALTAIALSGESAAAQQAVTCPLRMTTTAARVADPAAVAGFDRLIGHEGDSQSWLNGVAVYAGTVTAEGLIAGTPRGRRQLDWALDGQREVFVACLYEGGIVLSRGVGKARSCSAAFIRSTEPGAAHWGLQSGQFNCR